jgi:hypothetical protein
LSLSDIRHRKQQRHDPDEAAAAILKAGSLRFARDDGDDCPAFPFLAKPTEDAWLRLPLRVAPERDSHAVGRTAVA